MFYGTHTNEVEGLLHMAAVHVAVQMDVHVACGCVRVIIRQCLWMLPRQP